MAATEAHHSREIKTNRRDGVSLTVKGSRHGGGLLILGGTLFAAAVGATFAYHQSRANKKTTTPPAAPPVADEDFVTGYDGKILDAGGDTTVVHQSLILNELASADGPAVESVVAESIEAVRKPIPEELPDVDGAEEIKQQVEKEREGGEGTESSVDENDVRGEEGSDGTGSSLVESSVEVAVWKPELIDNCGSPTRHDVICTGGPAVESSASDIVETASKQISEESPLPDNTDVIEIGQQVEMNIQEDEMSSITGTQGEGSNSSVDDEEEGEEKESDRSSGLSSFESSAEAVVWPAKQIDNNCGKILLAGGDATMELIRHDQVVSAKIFKAASEPISEESPATDYVKEVEQLVELYLEEGDIPPIIGFKGEAIDSSIDQSSTQAVWPEELINEAGEKALATESNEKEEAQQYVLPIASKADNNEASVTVIVKGTSLSFMEESPVVVDVEEIKQILELNCEEGQIPSAAEPVWQAGLIDEEEKSSATELQEKEEPKQYVLSTASQATTEESSVTEIVKAASEPTMEELPDTGNVKEFEQQVDMNCGEGEILLTIGSQGGITDSAIDQSSTEAVYPAELINQEEKSLTTESQEKEEPQQYVLPSAIQEAIEESYFTELFNGASQPIIEESPSITDAEEIKPTVEANHEEGKIQWIVGSQGEGTDSCVDEEDERGEVELDGTGSFTVESCPEAIWPVEMTKEEERRPLITESTEKEELQENVLLIASQSICTKTVALAATMRSNKVTHSRAFVMLLALILVLGFLSLACVDLHKKHQLS